MTANLSITSSVQESLRQVASLPDPWPVLRAGHRWLQRGRRHDMQVDDHRLVWLERGTPSADRPTVVLMHGLAANKENWALWWAMLPRDWHVIALDLPGFGESDYLPGASYRYTAQADRLMTWLAMLGLERVHLVGSSMGGAIATLMKGNNSNRIVSLSVLNSAGIPASEEVDLDRKPEFDASLLIPEDWAGVNRMFSSVGNGKKDPISLAMAAVVGKDLLKRAGQHRHVFNDMRADGWAPTRVLGQSTDPLLVMWGDRDRITLPGCVDFYREKTPQAELHVFRGVGHLPMLEKPRHSADVLIQFVRRHHQ